jgi:hypothetical protein
MNEEYILFSSPSVFQEVAMARTRRATASSEPPAPVPSPPASDKAAEAGERAIWIGGVSGLSVIVILISLSYLLQIYTPSVSQLLVLGTAGSAAGLLAMWPLVSRLLKSVAISPVISELMKRLSGAFGRPGVALGLALLAVAVAPLTRWHWQASAHCPILRILPDGDLAYYLEDGEEADKPPEKTFEVRVRWKDEERRFHPRDDRALDIGASESVLRWRATREAREKDAPPRSYLGTSRFHPGDVVAIEVVCRKPDGLSLGRVEKTIDAGQDSMEIVRLRVDETFARKVAACEPI